MKDGSPSAVSPTPNADDRSTARLWPILLDIARGHRAGAASASRLDARASRLDASASRLDAWPSTTGDGRPPNGPWDAEAMELFDLLEPLLASGTWVIAQLGQSLDGFVATRSGDSRFINGPENLLHLHRLRALCDAVIVGAGTVAADNPRLTTRLVAGPHPTRVLLDPRLRLAGHLETAHVFNDGQAPTLWLCDARWRDDAVARVGADRVLAVPGLLGQLQGEEATPPVERVRDDRVPAVPDRPADDSTPNLPLAVAALRSRGLARLFVEGGGVTVSRFLAQRCLDRLHLAVAPVLIGEGRPGLRFAGPAKLADCLRPRCRTYRMGPDHLWDLDLRTATQSP